MKAKRSFRPAVQQVEDRIVLSFSLSNFLNSIFPGIDKPHAAKPHAAKPHAAPIAHPAHTVAHPHALGHPHGIHALTHRVKH